MLQPEKGGDPAVVKESQKKRGAPDGLVDEVTQMYKDWVACTCDVLAAPRFDTPEGKPSLMLIASVHLARLAFPLLLHSGL